MREIHEDSQRFNTVVYVHKEDVVGVSEK